MNNNKILFYFLTSGIVILSVFPSDVILPAIPNISRDLSQSTSTSLSGITIYLIVFGISTVFSGILSDRFGNKRVITYCLTISILGALICALSDNSISFIFGRLLEAVGASSFGLIHSVIRKNFQSNQANTLRVFISTFSGLLISSAPLFGAILINISNWRFLFLLFSSIAILTLILSLNYFRVTKEPAFPTPLKSHKLLKNFWKNNFIGLFAFLSHFSFILISVYAFMEHYKFSEIKYGLWMLVYGGAFATSGIAYSKKIKKIEFESQIRVGISLIALSCLLFFIFPIYSSPLGLMAPACIGAIGVTFIQAAATTLALESAPSEKNGLYTSLLTVTRFSIGGIFLSLLLLDIDFFFINYPSIILTISLILIGLQFSKNMPNPLKINEK